MDTEEFLLERRQLQAQIERSRLLLVQGGMAKTWRWVRWPWMGWVGIFLLTRFGALPRRWFRAYAAEAFLKALAALSLKQGWDKFLPRSIFERFL